jgi:hypothetical protein
VLSWVLVVACGSGGASGVGNDGGGGGIDATAPPDASVADAPGGGGSDATPPPDAAVVDPPLGGTDPNPTIQFTQVAKTVGIDRTNEPSSAGAFTEAISTLIYGSWLADLDGDGRLDYFGVNHGQYPHLSGLFLGNGAGGFGKNLYTVAIQLSPDAYPHMDLTNEVRFVGDLTGDGLVDIYFTGWYGYGALCVNQGVAQHADWTGPSLLCYGTSDGVAFADVNGDGKIDVLQLDDSKFCVGDAYYSQTEPYFWRLNNGSPNINTWPTKPAAQFPSLRVIDSSPIAVAAPFVDLNNDGIPDKIVGIQPPLPNGACHTDTKLDQQEVFLGQANGGYTQVPISGLESATAPITRLEDVNGDGCVDVGTDITAYRDNQDWYIQNKSGTTCTATFTATPRTALPYYPGFKHYDVDIDNSGSLSKVVIIHTNYGTNDGLPGGVSIYRKQANGSYAALAPAQSGININGAITNTNEFYADNLSPGDWDDDGHIDLAGTGTDDIVNTDSGLALWRSNVATSNRWIKITLPTVTGFFAGPATIEVFESGHAGDAAHLVTPARKLFTGKTWATQVHHFGIGLRSTVDVRVTFPDGHQVTRAVAASSRTSIAP